MIGRRTNSHPKMSGGLAALLGALVLALSSCSGGDPVWSIHTKASGPGGGESVRQVYKWNPVTNRIVGIENDIQDSHGIEEVREAGYSTRPSGHLFVGEMRLSYKKGEVREYMTLRPDRGSEDAAEGTLHSRMYVGRVPQPMMQGDYWVFVPEKYGDPQEFLAESSPSYLYWQAKEQLEAARYEEALAAMDKALELQEDFTKALEIKRAAHDRLGQYEEAYAATSRMLEIKKEAGDSPDMEDYLNIGEAAMKAGHMDVAEQNFVALEEHWVDRGSYYEQIWSDEKVERVLNKANALQLVFYHAQGDAAMREQFFEYIDANLRTADLEEQGAPIRIRLAGADRHPATVASVARILPTFSANESPRWQFAREWEKSLIEQVSALDDRMIPILKQRSGAGRQNELPNFDQRIREGDFRFLHQDVMSRASWDYFQQHEDCYEVLMWLGEVDAAYDFGLHKHFKYKNIELYHSTIKGNVDRAKEIVDDLASRPEAREYLPEHAETLEGYLASPAYQDCRRSIGSVISHIKDKA